MAKNGVYKEIYESQLSVTRDSAEKPEAHND
jgi:hypothetical protein